MLTLFEKFVSNGKLGFGANGEIDGPSEAIVRGNRVIVMNFDAVFDSPDMIMS